jgi:hypothetical protein
MVQIASCNAAIASVMEIDEVIDPAETAVGSWLVLNPRQSPNPRSHRKRPCIDAW